MMVLIHGLFRKASFIGSGLRVRLGGRDSQDVRHHHSNLLTPETPRLVSTKEALSHLISMSHPHGRQILLEQSLAILSSRV